MEITQASVLSTSYPTSVPRSFDACIDDFVEFQETVLQEQELTAGVLTVADALFKLEASRVIGSVELPQFDESALSYPEFIDRFKIHIHDKKHLKDDRMIQLKMHVVGEVERAISGFGSKGVMYATALKEQFGHPSQIARSVINKLIKGEKNHRPALREFSLDLINCLATIQQIQYSADLNANESTRLKEIRPSRNATCVKESIKFQIVPHWPTATRRNASTLYAVPACASRVWIKATWRKIADPKRNGCNYFHHPLLHTDPITVVSRGKHPNRQRSRHHGGLPLDQTTKARNPPSAPYVSYIPWTWRSFINWRHLGYKPQTVAVPGWQ